MAINTKLDKFADEVVRDMIKTLRHNVSKEKTRMERAENERKAKGTSSEAPKR